MAQIPYQTLLDRMRLAGPVSFLRGPALSGKSIFLKQISEVLHIEQGKRIVFLSAPPFRTSEEVMTFLGSSAHETFHSGDDLLSWVDENEICLIIDGMDRISNMATFFTPRMRELKRGKIIFSMRY